MKKQIIVIMTILIAICALLSACSPIESTVRDDVVRIHIRANSNQTIDQEVKLKVRDEITRYLTNSLSACSSKEDAMTILGADCDVLQKIADDTLRENGFSYSSQVRLTTERFPQKTYGDYTFPEGDYDALIIYLGDGIGDNWWCVAFPPLCFVPDDGEGKIVYKSWVKEMLDKIFNKKE